MAQLIKNYNFGFPLNTVEGLDNVEQNLLTDDQYGSNLVGIHSTLNLFSLPTVLT